MTRPCSGTEHELRWREGRLALPDHDDVAAEVTLGALGGSTPSCLRVADAWSALDDDPVLVTLGRRPGEADIGLAGSPPGSIPGARTIEAEEPTRRDRLLLLFSLPATFIDRLVLTAAAAADRHWLDPAFRDRHGLRIGAALAARATPALRRLGGELAGPDEALVVHAVPTDAGRPPTIRATRTADGLAVTAALPVHWISSVWGPGISEPDGRMVLAVRAVVADGRRLDVVVAEWMPDGSDRWEVAPRHAVLVREGDADPWRLDPG
jgi:hypothetical protein